MRRTLKIVVVAAVLAIPSVALAAGSTQTWAINCGREQYKPRGIIVTCADAGVSLSRLEWSRWTHTTARATGIYNENTCTPSCAAGHNVSKPVEVTLSKPRTCPGRAHPAFSRATFSFPSGAPPSALRRFTFSCPY